MAKGTRTKRRHPSDPPNAAGARRAAEAHRLARREAQERRQRKGEEVAEKFRGQFRDILGSAHFTELRDLMRRERMAFRNLLLPPTGLKLNFRKADSAARRKPTPCSAA